MKNKLSRFASLLLVFAILVSVISVYAAASDGDGESADVQTIFNRGFDDGWEATNGASFGGTKYHTCLYGKEYIGNDVNRYVDMTSSGEAQACYYQMFPPLDAMAGVTDYVLEFDMKSSGYTLDKKVSFLYTRLEIDGGHSDVTLIRKLADGSLVFEAEENALISESVPSEWTHFTFVFNVQYDTDGDNDTFTYSCYVDGEYLGQRSLTLKVNNFSSLFRFQLCSSGGCNAGDNLSFDNIKLYTGTSEPVELDADDYGLLVDTTVEKTIKDGMVTTIFNRGFDDGWEATNGANFAGSKTQTVGYGKEPTRAGGVNRYIHMVSTGAADACYYQLVPKTTDVKFENKYVMEFDMRSDGITTSNMLSFFYLKINGSSYHVIRKKASTEAIYFDWGGANIKIADRAPDEWTHFSFVFEADMTAGTVSASCYVDGEFIGKASVTPGGDIYPTHIRLQLCSSGGCNAGDSISFDNVKYYVGTNEVTELRANDYGTIVDTTVAKTQPIEYKNPDYVENAKYLAMCLEYALDYDEASWAENGEVLSYVTNKIRGILLEGRYDPDHEGLGELIEAYEPMGAYFYAKLQAEHIAAISALIASYDASESYYEKMAFCHEVEKYVLSADIDPTNAELMALIALNESNKASLGDEADASLERMKEYADLFVATIDSITDSVGYSDIVAIIDEADRYYHYLIVADTDNSTKAQIEAAIEKYHYYTSFADATRAASLEFIVLVGSLSDASYSERYLMLVDAKSLLGSVSENINGVSEAIAEYNEIYQEYTAVVSAANAEIGATQAAVISLRVDRCIGAVLKMLTEIFGIAFN